MQAVTVLYCLLYNLKQPTRIEINDHRRYRKTKIQIILRYIRGQKIAETLYSKWFQQLNITMANRLTDTVFILIKSLETAEKRNFKMYARRSDGEAQKTVQLFDALDKMNEYDEELLLKKNKAIKKQQLSNLKAQLYKQLLASLRLIKNEENIDLLLHEQMDHARILYNKGLFVQSLKVLDKMKEMARQHHQFTYLQQVLFFEKKLESLHITRGTPNRADQLAQESQTAIERLSQISRLSNLSLQLYNWYITNGHARSKMQEEEVQQFFDSQLPAHATLLNGFYEKLYLYQSYTWYAFILQDYLMYYRYTQKWVDLFIKEPVMMGIETNYYIKGLYNLCSAHFALQNADKFNETLKIFEKFSQSAEVQQKDNTRIQTFIYYNLSLINKYFMEGTFTAGLKMVPSLTEKLDEYELFLDQHRLLVFYYKIACLYFGSGDNEKTVDYLNIIINKKTNSRSDLQCYARLLHLIAHYELGNYNLLEYLIKSVYRFMGSMYNLSVVEEAMFAFLRKSFHLRPRELQPAFQQLLEKIKKHERSRYETRAFAYLDITSWLESKLQKTKVQDIIREKFLNQQNKKQKTSGS
jgi:hypothetical protein